MTTVTTSRPRTVTVHRVDLAERIYPGDVTLLRITAHRPISDTEATGLDAATRQAWARAFPTGGLGETINEPGRGIVMPATCGEADDLFAAWARFTTALHTVLDGIGPHLHVTLWVDDVWLPTDLRSA